MLQVRMVRKKGIKILNEWRARRFLKQRLPLLTYRYHEPPVHVYATERAHQVLDVEHIAKFAAEVVRHLTRFTGETISPPTHIYLHDPDPPMGDKRLIQGFRWGGILVDSSAIVYSITLQHVCRSLGREIVHTALSRACGNYFFFCGGLAEYLGRLNDDTFFYEVAAFMNNRLMYSMDDILDGYAPAPAAGSFARFLTERFGGEIWQRLYQNIRALRRGLPPLYTAVPTTGWLLEKTTGFSVGDLAKQWEHFVHLQCQHLDQQQRQSYLDKFAINRLYEDENFRECADTCLRYLATYHESDTEAVFYAAASYARLGNYLQAIQVLSSQADSLPEWHQAWAYLRLGQLYDMIGDRTSALHSYTAAQNLSDVWGVIRSQAERYIARPFSASPGRKGYEDWLHFRRWDLGYNDRFPALQLSHGAPYTVLTLYYSSQA